ncbi:MAG TPA: hypothetical protein VF331_07865 [Polyangiales bacterium]
MAHGSPSIETWQIGTEPNLSAFSLVAFKGVYARAAQAVVDAFAAKGRTHKLALAGMGYYGDYIPPPGPQYPTQTGSMILDLVTLRVDKHLSCPGCGSPLITARGRTRRGGHGVCSAALSGAAP